MKLSAVASLIGLCVIGSVARADELYSTLSQGVHEVSHTVEVRITDGVATYVVRRQFANPGKVADEATLTIQLPPGAAATGLRIKAHDRWYDGDLLASDRAAALYRELTGFGAYDPKDPALLSWAAADQLHLQVFPVMPGQVSTVEYTLTAPTGYAHGRYWIAYPRLMPSASERGEPGWPGEPRAGQLVTPVVTVRPAWPTAGAAIQLEGKPAPAGAAIALTAMRPVQDPFDQASDDVPRGVPVGYGVTTDRTDTPFLGDDTTVITDPTFAVISVTPPPIGTWAVRFGRVVASAAHAFARLEIDVAPALTAVPRRAQVVFIVDASYSVGAAQLATELAIIRAYLSHMPDAEVEIIVSRRRATRWFGTFVPVPTALAALADRRGFALGNGSAIDDAARVAAAALADRHGPRRVVVLTDELFRDALTPDRALAAFAALAADAVVHVVVPELQAAGLELPNEPGLVLVDAYDDQFAALATRHHGIHVALNVPAPAGAEVGRVAAPTGAMAGKLAVAVLELVRPIKIEEVSVTGLTTEVAGTLREGEGVRLVDSTGSPPFAITLRGRLWSDPIHVELSPLTGFSQQTAAFLAGAGHLDELSPDEQFAVARYAGAVSPVTSYLAIEPGTRPSPLGLERGGYGTVGYGSGGGGLGYGLGSGDHGLILPRPDPGALIDTAPCVAQLRPQAYWRADLTLQTTKDEIVDVIVDSGGAGGATGPSGPSGPSGHDALTRCLVEQAWATHLDPSWFTQSREDFHVAFGSEISHPTVWHR